jgi:hypothetical protein
MTPVPFPLPKPRSCHRHGRNVAAALAAVLALGCALPITDDVAFGAAGESPVGGTSAAVLSVLDHGGESIGVLPDLTLPQLASLLGTAPASLISEIDSVAGDGLVGSLLQELLGDPGATLGTLIADVEAGGGSGGAVEHLINSLLGPATATSGQLQGVINTLLSDLAADGQLGTLATELNVPLSVLERAGALPVSTESLAATLNTTVEGLGSLLLDAGALTTPLGGETPLVTIPVLSTVETGAPGTTEVVAVPGEKGVSLTTVYSSSSPTTAAAPTPAATVLGIRSAAPNSAFTIVSVKLGRGQILETVRVPAKGRVTVKAIGSGALASSHRTRSVPVAGVDTGVAAGTHTLTLRPGRTFSEVRSLALALTTTYTPSGGSANTKRTHVTLRHAVKRT